MSDELDSWLAAVEPHLPARVESVARLHGGTDSDVYRLTGSGIDLVLHALPGWTSRARVDWVQGVVRHVHATVQEAIPPVPIGGASALEVAGRILTLSQYVSGSPLDRDSDLQRASAAQVLARIHRATTGWVDGKVEVATMGGPVLHSVPEWIQDEILKSWWQSIEEECLHAVAHGDFYRGNLICSADRVVGVVDWHEARVQSLLMEVAAATFEICRDESHSLDLDRASSFLAEYRSAEGPIPVAESPGLIRAMRVWVQEDAVRSLAYSGGKMTEYVRRQARAFQALRALESVELW